MNIENLKAGSRSLSADDQNLGTVEDVEGAERLRITRAGADANDTPDFIPASWVASFDDGVVKLNRSAAQVHETINDDIPAGEQTS